MWEQLTYTSVDEVVDFKQISGWHVKDRSSGLTNEQVKLLLSFVRQTLTPIQPLERFPTHQEIRESDRRLSQFSTPWGTALVHTAPAGRDATQRPNTVSHVLLETGDDGELDYDLIDFWRAEWWLTPYGHEAVKQSSLPPVDVIAPGEALNDDVIEQFLTEPGRLNALGALVDAVALGKEKGAINGNHRTAVMPIKSSDEAAYWIAALSWLTLPANARQISWSTLERVTSPIDARSLLGRGLDIAFVPEIDLIHLRTEGTGLLLLSSSLDQPIEPKSRWGSLASGALESPEVFFEVCGAVRGVMEELESQADISYAWPLAMAELLDPGLLRPLEGTKVEQEQANLINRELLTCQSSSWEQNAYLSKVIQGRFGEENWTAEQWHLVIMDLNPGERVNHLLISIAQRYIRAAMQDAQWLLRSPQRSESVHACVNAWSEGVDDQELDEVFQTAVETLMDSHQEESDGWCRLSVLEKFLADGVKVTEEQWDRFLDSTLLWDSAVPDRQWPSLDSAVTARNVSPEVRARIIERIESALHLGTDPEKSTPLALKLPADMSDEDLKWLCTGVDVRSAPIVRAAYALMLWQQEQSHETKRSFVNSLTAVTMKYKYTLEESVIRGLAPKLVPTELARFDGLLPDDFDRLMFQYLLANQDSPRSAEVARTYMKKVDLPTPAKDDPRPRLTETQALAIVLAVAKTVTVTRSDALFSHALVSAAASELLESNQQKNFLQATKNTCSILEWRVHTADLLRAWATGARAPIPPASKKQKKHFQRLREGDLFALRHLFAPADDGRSEEFDRAVRFLCMRDAPEELLLVAQESAPVSVDSPPQDVPGENEGADSEDEPRYPPEGPLPESSEAVQSLLRARFLPLGDPLPLERLFSSGEDSLIGELNKAGRLAFTKGAPEEFLPASVERPPGWTLEESEALASLQECLSDPHNPLYRSSATVRNILRARFLRLEMNQRDQLWEHLASILPPVYGREWLQKQLGFVPSRRTRLPWGSRLRKGN